MATARPIRCSRAGSRPRHNRNPPLSDRFSRHKGRNAMKKYAYAWITLGFFLVSLILHWVFGWSSYVDESREHGQVAETSAYVNQMLRETFENWQSEFLQLLWQVVGLAYFLYVGSPSSKENDDRLEAKIDSLLRLHAGT